MSADAGRPPRDSASSSARRLRPLIGLVVLLLLLGGWLALGGAGPSASRLPTNTTATASTGTAQNPTSSGRPTSPSTSRAPAGQSTDPSSGLRWVSLSQLPAQASDTLASIKAGPPYRFPRNDGVVYHNFNRVLPSRPDGYYLEFTVVTPGSDDRGARRIIAGGPDRGLANAEWYYTPDHYSSFERIRP